MKSFVDFTETANGALIGKGVTIGLYTEIGSETIVSSEAGIGCSTGIVNEEPTIIGFGCFIGAGSQVHNVAVGPGAILYGSVYVDNFSPIIDLTKENHPTYHGKIPPGAIVMMAVHPKGFSCPHIFAYREPGESVERALKRVL